MKASTLLSALTIVALSITTSTAVRAQAQPALADAQFEVVIDADGVAVRELLADLIPEGRLEGLSTRAS